jgi:hypothetical protein
MAVFVAAILIPHHPSKGVADRNKGELDERQRGHPPARTLRPDQRLSPTISLRPVSKHSREQFVLYRIILVMRDVP